MKNQIRKQARETRRLLFESKTEKELLDLEHQRIERFFNSRYILKALDKSEAVLGVYISMGSEASTDVLYDELTRRGIRTAVPVLDPVVNKGRMGFIEVNDLSDLMVSEHRFAQPTKWSESDLICPDVLVVPMLAFDKNGHRLGYGKGHYDQYFANEVNHRAQPSLRIGWAYARQHVPKIMTYDSDIPMDLIITEHKEWLLI